MWIEYIPYEKAQGQLLKLYDRVKGPNNNVDNLILAHSLRPHTAEGHMALYKNVLHHPRNKIPTWFLETMGVYVSMLNGCEYCINHHFTGMKRLIKDDARSAAIHAELSSGKWGDVFDSKEIAALEHVRKLTETPAEISPDDIEALRDAGWDDGEILEINQLASYFNYANRTVTGLGITTQGDILGLSPSDTEHLDDWHHR